MDFDYLLAQLTHNAALIGHLSQGLADRQARWKPDPASWSILEVINHLYDEEREDFPVRLDIILHRPDQPWPPIDPEGWVSQRHYNERELGRSLENFLREREKSLAWLRSLGQIDWQASCNAPWGGPITAGDMFAAWVAHDTLHMGQLVELRQAYIIRQAQPHRVDYAGF